MNITKKVLALLESFEVSELQRILEAMEQRELIVTGLNRISGGYAKAEAYDVEHVDYDEELDEHVDNIEIELESGQVGEGYTNCNKTCYTISQSVVKSPRLQLSEKLKAVREA